MAVFLPQTGRIQAIFNQRLDKEMASRAGQNDDKPGSWWQAKGKDRWKYRMRQ